MTARVRLFTFFFSLAPIFHLHSKKCTLKTSFFCSLHNVAYKKTTFDVVFFSSLYHIYVSRLILRARPGTADLLRRWNVWINLSCCVFAPVCREILQEIQRLRLQHEEASQPPPDKVQQNPTLLAELRLLR